MNQQISNTAPHWRATMTWRSLRLPVLLAMLAVCTQAQAQGNATGMPEVTYASGIMVPTEDSAITANKGNIQDPDNTPTTAIGAISWQWSAADTDGGNYTDIAMATNDAFTPGDDEVGKFLQVCASFTDNASNNEKRCLQIATAVANINDKPVPIANTISVSTAADADNPYVFSADDFPFTDADDDMLAGINLVTLPGRDPTAGPGSPGTMALNGTALTAVPASTITVAQLEAGALTYYPPPGEQPTDPDALFLRFAFFNFDVTDDGSDGNTNNASNDGQTIEIRLVSVAQTAVSGRPRIIVDGAHARVRTHAEGSLLQADTIGIVEPNGINRSTLEWQWQSSSASDGAFADISGATEGTFTPGQVHVGMHIRVCASFMDNHPTPETVEGLCSPSIRVTEANVAPISDDASVSVSPAATAAQPYRFKVSDFPFRDTVGDRLLGITIVSTVESGKGTLRFSSLEITLRDNLDTFVIDGSRIPEFTYYPPAGSGITSDFATFRFRVSDGKAESAIHAMTIHLAEHLRLRLRLFLEGPLR